MFLPLKEATVRPIVLLNGPVETDKLHSSYESYFTPIRPEQLAESRPLVKPLEITSKIHVTLNDF